MARTETVQLQSHTRAAYYAILFQTGKPVRNRKRMFGYRRHAFKKSVTLLSAIRHDPVNLEALQGLQDLLISEITLAERRIQQLRNSARVETDVRSKYHTRIRSLRRTTYYWRTFGDAIAFLYLDRFTLKHVFYNTHNLNPKQPAGFIAGSIGLSLEVEIRDRLIEHGIPCVLTDLTNTIRYGDICMLDGPDPQLIEVKSSKTKDRRQSRQRERLRRLDEFYKTDRLPGLRGFPVVERVSTHTDYDTHSEKFNRCIRHAYDHGHAVVSPEAGVYYVAVVQTSRSMEEIIQRIRASKVWLVYLNSFKSDGSWAPYYPFTLLIESGRALYDFLLGRLHLTVLLDIAVVEQRVIDMGYSPQINMNDDYFLRIRRLDTDGEVGVAKHLLLRVALEAMSMEWVLRTSLSARDRLL